MVDNSTNCSIHMHTLIAYITASKRGVELRATYSSHSFTCCQTKMLRKANYGQLNNGIICVTVVRKFGRTEHYR